MSDHSGFIAVNWGNTNFQAYLVSSSGEILKRASGPGVSGVQGGAFEQAYFDAVGDWIDETPELESVITGGVTSNLGWVTTSYAALPCQAGALIAGTATRRVRGHRVHFLPGVSCRNPFGQIDVMRSEEIEVLGCQRLEKGLSDAIVCCPGTHGKWVVIKEGRIETFLSAYSGEMYALLREHGVLLANLADAPFDPVAFNAGVDLALTHAETDLIHLLFGVRGAWVSGEAVPETQASFLSGLIIGRDVSGGYKGIRGMAVDGAPLYLIGSDRNIELYELAFERAGLAYSAIASEAVTVAGLETIYQAIREGAE